MKVGDIVKTCVDVTSIRDRKIEILTGFGLVVRDVYSEMLSDIRDRNYTKAPSIYERAAPGRFFNVLWMDGEIEWIHVADLEVVIEGR